ncbi:MAG: phosphoribosylglycinamide formyltransferase [Ferruginibacter sp.]|nr:phosphoribosylglycinamide formyltransferase [Ferruginibacter sp.]
MGLLQIENRILYLISYLIIISTLWPFSVLLVSLPLGQFVFFKNYIKKIYNKFVFRKKLKNKSIIAIFASGSGSNAKNIISHFKNKDSAFVGLVVCNNKEAGVVKIAEQHQVPVLMIDRNSFKDTQFLINELKKRGINWIILAGFLWKLPVSLIESFKGKIINIHPALLPLYGGKGMYGKFVHEAVIKNKEKESGITIHIADEYYDHGEIVFQQSISIDENETPETLEAKVRQLEIAHYPTTIESYISKQTQG